MARYLDQRQQLQLGQMNRSDRDKLLFWFAPSSDVGSFLRIHRVFHRQGDLEALEGGDADLDRLLEQLRLGTASAC